MDRRVAFLLAAISPAGLAVSAFAQQGYPYMPAYPGYAPAMPMQVAPGYGMYGQPAMPVMAVPVPYPVMVTRPVPMFGAIETMPANGPLGATGGEQVTAQKPVEHVVAKQSLAGPEEQPAGASTTVQAKATVTAAQPAAPAAPAAPTGAAKTDPAKPPQPSMFQKFTNWLDSTRIK